MADIIKDKIDDSVTYVFVEDNETSTIIKTLKAQLQEQTKNIKCKWDRGMFSS